MIRVSAVTLSLLLLSPVRLGAQGDRWEREVTARIERVARTLAAQGYRTAGRVAEGVLFVDESREVEVPVVAGLQYLLLGSCDADCTGLSLVIANHTGYQLDADRGPGVTPTVRLDPLTSSGSFRLTVTVTGCRVSPCRYGVARFERRSTARVDVSRRGLAGPGD